MTRNSFWNFDFHRYHGSIISIQFYKIIFEVAIEWMDSNWIFVHFYCSNISDDDPRPKWTVREGRNWWTILRKWTVIESNSDTNTQRLTKWPKMVLNVTEIGRVNDYAENAKMVQIFFLFNWAILAFQAITWPNRGKNAKMAHFRTRSSRDSRVENAKMDQLVFLYELGYFGILGISILVTCHSHFGPFWQLPCRKILIDYWLLTQSQWGKWQLYLIMYMAVKWFYWIKFIQ